MSETYKQNRHMELKDNKLVGHIEQKGEIRLEGFDGPQGTFVDSTVQHFDEEGTKNLPKYVDQGEERTQAQLAKVKADLARLGTMKVDKEMSKQNNELIALLRTVLKNPEMKRIQKDVADKIGALNQEVTRRQQHDLLLPQEKQLLDQLKRIREDRKMISDLYKKA